MRVCAPVSGITHGTKCYRIFRDKVNAPYRLISIKVLDDATGTGKYTAFSTALRWCAEREIDLINISMGTRQFTDFESVSKAVKHCTTRKKAPKTVIVAACSNQNTLTLPACLPDVISVRHCDCKALRDGIGIAYIPASYDQTDVMTCVKPSVNTPSNSLAAPLISAYVCDLLAQGYSGLEAVRKKLMTDAIDDDRSFIHYEFYKSLLSSWETVGVPVILWPDSAGDSFDKLRALIRRFVQDGYRSAALSLNQQTNVTDFVFQLSAMKSGQTNAPASLPALVELYYNFILPDILFLHMDASVALTLPEGMRPDIIIDACDREKDTESLFSHIKMIFADN